MTSDVGYFRLIANKKISLSANVSTLLIVGLQLICCTHNCLDSYL